MHGSRNEFPNKRKQQPSVGSDVIGASIAKGAVMNRPDQSEMCSFAIQLQMSATLPTAVKFLGEILTECVPVPAGASNVDASSTTWSFAGKEETKSFNFLFAYVRVIYKYPRTDLRSRRQAPGGVEGHQCFAYHQSQQTTPSSSGSTAM